jgi:DNA polymerase
MKRLWNDYETWSSIPIKRGTDAYMSEAKPLFYAYAIDDGPVRVHDFVLDGFLRMPQSFKDTVDEVWAHNAYFDRHIDQFDLPAHKWRCTSAMATAHSLPGGLGPLCAVLGIDANKAKDHDGKRLIRLFCGPNNPYPTRQWLEDNNLMADWLLFKEYAGQDVVAMRECFKLMPNWNYKGEELRTWQTDQEINGRGFAVDVPFVKAAVAALDEERKRLAGKAWDFTDGYLESATQRDKLLQYMCENNGVFLPDLKSSTIEEALKDDSIDDATKELLRLRLEASKASISKYSRLLSSVGVDSRLRGTLLYCGAGRTGRWAGRLFQPHNLPRLGSYEQSDVRAVIPVVTEGRADCISLIRPLNEALSQALRGVIVAPHGKVLQVGDYSSIEGRGNAWLSGEQWKLEAFRTRQDLYKLIYAKAFGVDVKDVTKAQRQQGKVMELALGYGGGVGAFVNMASSYGMDLDELGRTVTPADRAVDTWDWAVKKNFTHGLSKEAWLACETLKIGYRIANPAIAAMWGALEFTVRAAIVYNNPANRVQAGLLMIDANRQWLRIQLPSGRYLCYAQPKVDDETNEITYMQWHNKKWLRVSTYGGKLVENVVQAISRDVLRDALLRFKDYGYKTVLHVHDEIINEIDKGAWPLSEFLRTMAMTPEWAQGFPIDVEGFETERYEKR